MRENTAVPICIGERLFTRFDFAPILERRLADFIMPDVCWTGGISELRRIGALAEAHYVPLSPHNAAGPIQIAAGSHVALTTPNFYRLEHAMNWIPALQRAAAGAAGIRARLPDGERPAGPWRRHRRGLPGGAPLLGLGMKITGVERIELDVGFTPRTEPHMRRGIADFSLIEICRVTTDTGIVGWGESRAMHNWDRDMDAVDAGVLGRNPAELLWRDELGSGLQQAMFDVTGKSLGVPAHRLIGRQARAWVPLAWWCYDMPPEDWAAEAEDALAAGYTAFKLKPRPWFDLMAQMDAISAVTPDHATFDLDFNGFLLDAGFAQHVLAELEAYPKIHMFETPIPQRDVAGNATLRASSRRAIALHFPRARLPHRDA